MPKEEEGEVVDDQKATPVPRVKSYPPDAVLTKQDVCEWLQISEKTLLRMGIKRIQLLETSRIDSLIRYMARDVYDYLEKRVR